MVIAQSEAGEILKPHLERFWNCIVGAWREYLQEYAHIKHVHTDRKRASILHDHMVDRARKEFQGVKGVHFLEGRLFLLSIDQQIIVRFKKLDDDMKSRNYPTLHALKFLQQLDIPGIPPVTRVEAGYQLNGLETGIQAVLITCREGAKLEWFLELDRPAGNVADIVEMPIKPSPAGPDGPSRIKIKEGEIKEDKKNGEQGN